MLQNGWITGKVVYGDFHMFPITMYAEHIHVKYIYAHAQIKTVVAVLERQIVITFFRTAVLSTQLQWQWQMTNLTTIFILFCTNLPFYYIYVIVRESCLLYNIPRMFQASRQHILTGLNWILYLRARFETFEPGKKVERVVFKIVMNNQH